MPRRTRYSLPAVLLCGLLSAASWAMAQTDPAIGSSDPESAADETATGADIIYMQDAQGNWQARPAADQTLPSLLDLLQPDDSADAEVPEFFISKLTLSGEVQEQWCALTAKVEVHAITGSRWLRVPLRFDQAVLLTCTYAGDGDAAPAAATPEDSGLLWLLRGKGQHTLTLSLRVPLRRTASGSQLQLNLPERPAFLGGELELKLPPDSFVESGDSVQLLNGSNAEAGAGSIRAILPGERLDLRWHPIVEESTPIMRTLTNSTVRLNNGHVQYSARQEIRLRNAGLSHVDVRLPTGGFQPAQTVRLNELSGAERQVAVQSTEQPGWVRVPLAGVQGTFVRIDWMFETPFDESTHQLTIDGLEVAGADDQSGTISIEGFDRHLLTRRPDSVEGVSRIGVGELPAAGAFANLAYRFQTGSYRLVLDVDPIESTFRATPIYVLELSKTRARLSTRFLMSIDEGQVDALSVVWPDFADQGWAVEPLAIGGGEVHRDEVTETLGQADESDAQRSSSSRWLLKPSSPLTNRSVTGFVAEQILSPMDDQAELSLHFPQVTGARTLPGICVVATADEVEARVDVQRGTKIFEPHSSPEHVRDLLENLGDQARQVFTLQPDSGEVSTAISVALQIQALQVSVQSLVRVDSVETSPRVTQRFDINVDFGRLSSIRLRVPEEIVGDIPEEFRDDALPFRLEDQPLPAVWRGSTVELSFPQPIRGTSQLVAGPYAAPAASVEAAAVRVPVITVVDRPYTTLRLVVPTTGTAAVEVADSSWTPLTMAVEGRDWITSESPESVEVGLDRSLQRVPQHVVIPVAWIQSQIDAAGTIRTVAQYKLGADPSRLVVRLPGDAVDSMFLWNGQPVDSSKVSEVPGYTGQYVVTLPDRDEDGWLGISSAFAGRPLDWHRIATMHFPGFGDEVAIEQTCWDLRLPLTQHLLIRPERLAPQYQWQRSGLVWRRAALGVVGKARSAFVASGAYDPGTTDASNTYSFETLGVMPQVQVQTMSNSLIVFLGAGLTLVASFLLLRVPASRNLWLWLTLGAGIAVASLWSLDAILLLLQPAAFGLVLPLAAVAFDRTFERKSVVAETLSTGQSFELTPQGANDLDGSSATGRDSVPSTLVRPTALSDSGAS